MNGDSLSGVLRDWLLAPVLERMEELFMATAEQLAQQITEAKDALTAAVGRVEEDVAELRRQIDAGVDPAALDSVSQGLTDLKGALDALDPDPTFPPPEA